MIQSRSILECRELFFHFDNTQPVLDNINLHLKSGELVVLTGPNGSGKTVLMKHLNGLLSPVRGDVFLNGRPLPRRGQEAVRAVGLVFQNPVAQFIEETVERDVAFGPRNMHLGAAEVSARVEDALQTAELQHLRTRDPLELSGGEQQRLALAGVLAMRSAFVILDEPFAHLDLPGVRSVLRAVLAARDRGVGVVVVTHDLEKILAHTDRLVVMRAGQIVIDDTPQRALPLVEHHLVRRPAGEISHMSWL